MPGRVLRDALTLPEPARSIASFEGTAGVAAAPADAAADPAILERLRSLGYLEATSPQGDRNLAAVLFQQQRFVEAERAYAALVRAQPDDGALRASWAGALGALGRLDEALAESDRAVALAPLNPEGYHNRAVILERRGARDAAIADYRAALRYSPHYEPARAALRRLDAAPVLAEPLDSAVRARAERASGLARRGDYAAALALLDEAARLAPRSALVQQYRANVAFLMGDHIGAAAALRAALALEPDNALYRENLARLGVPTPAAEP
jgi:tetratricopeptide (TPR) repeat protein